MDLLTVVITLALLVVGFLAGRFSAPRVNQGDVIKSILLGAEMQHRREAGMSPPPPPTDDSAKPVMSARSNASDFKANPANDATRPRRAVVG